MFAALDAFIKLRITEFDSISPERKQQLESLARYVRSACEVGMPVRLIFICTHNSRRSQMAQLWASAAAEYYSQPMSIYSGGTEATAFDRRAVAAMERAGFKIEKTNGDDNPVYQIRFAKDRPAISCFSKRFDHAPNPRDGFAAVMVCTSADQSCPTVAGSNIKRFAIPYDDPKRADGKPTECAVYDARCAEIARDMFYMMQRVLDHTFHDAEAPKEAIR